MTNQPRTTVFFRAQKRALDAGEKPEAANKPVEQQKMITNYQRTNVPTLTTTEAVKK